MNPQRVLVVFSDRADLKWLTILKHGYRHCFIIIEQGNDWLLCNALSHRMEFDIIRELSIVDIVDFYKHQGFKVVQTESRPVAQKCAPWGGFTCVEMVKRALGIHSFRVQTPWQLCRYIEKNHNSGKNT